MALFVGGGASHGESQAQKTGALAFGSETRP
jgi:hypothetical protein